MLTKDWAEAITIRNDDEIWIITYFLSLIRYRPSIHELVSYTVAVDEQSAFVPTDLFVSKNNTLWGIGNVGKTDVDPYFSGKFTGLLSRYVPEQDRFVPVSDKDGLLHPSPPPELMREDSHGILWILSDNALFRFDPTTAVAKRIWGKESGYAPKFLAIAPDDQIWLAVSPVEGDTTRIVRYDPITEKITDFGSPPGVEKFEYMPMRFDHAGHLWAGDFGWLESSSTGEETWHQIIRSPSFITDRAGGEYLYGWVRPEDIYESTDGKIWFSSIAGIVQLDPTVGKWCLITTLYSRVVEDSQKNLWAAGDGQIYKYPLKP